VARDEELASVIETLCRRTKRNPMLIGPAGVGKTAVVEGLAQRIMADQVPAMLCGVRVISLSTSSLTSGTGIVGSLEERMKSLLAEASQDGIILFIDEIHTVVGAGSGGQSLNDLANMLKPALARGDIACVAATTDEEYRRYIEKDTALERRFQPISIQKPTVDRVYLILQAVRDELSALRQVVVADNILRWIIEFSSQYLRNRHFLDKSIDLLEQCVAYSLPIINAR
jgi:ATP-dependent Clp protease ATP-binding subunit ClpC